MIIVIKQIKFAPDSRYILLMLLSVSSLFFLRDTYFVSKETSPHQCSAICVGPDNSGQSELYLHGPGGWFRDRQVTTAFC